MAARLDLSDEEVAAVVQRAHEINALEHRLESSESQYEQYVKVAEEMGVPRQAMEQALNERFAFLDQEVAVGQIVFARSGDGHLYPARVKAAAGGTVDVHYFNGSDGTVGLHDLQEASFSPGTQYDYYSEVNKFNVRGRVVRYDRDSLAVTFSTWGVEETVPLAKVRIRKESNRNFLTLRVWMIAGASLLAGGVAAALITWLVMR